MSKRDALFKAIARADIGAVKSLVVDRALANEPDSDGRTPLMDAILVDGGSEELVSLLIKAGADVKPKDTGQGWTALAFAARDGKARICALLLDAGADVDPTDTFGNTPLWRAAFLKHKDVVDLLLKKGADPDKTNRSGVSPRSLLELKSEH